MASAKVSLSISEEGGEEEEKRRVRGGRGGRGGRGEESRGGRGGRGGRGEESGGGEEEEEDKPMLVRHYQAQEMVLPRKPLLHPLLDKQISAWASVQVCAGVCSFALGVVFASTADFNSFLLILFRIPFLNGALLFAAGLLSNLLYREPRLLPVCFRANLACLGSGVVGVVVMCVDLAMAKEARTHAHKKTEILVLVMAVVQMVLSGLLIFWIYKEQKRLKTTH